MSELKSKTAAMLIVLIMCIPFHAFAVDEVTFFLEDEPVYTSKSKSSPGFLLEIVLEM